jgi:MOSC domain-containing protein YiiM
VFVNVVKCHFFIAKTFVISNINASIHMKISALFAAKPIPFGPRKSPSSIIKHSFEALSIELEGAREDEQGNKKLHGGPQMALHQFVQCSYQKLQQAFPDAADKMHIGSIGENISAPNMDESNVYIGDIYRIGEVLLQVSSPRAPCSKINQRYGKKKVDTFILENGLTGWYFRVLQAGKIAVNDTIALEARNENPVSVRTLMQMSKPLEGMHFSKEALLAAKEQAELAPEWQDKLARQLRKAQ